MKLKTIPVSRELIKLIWVEALKGKSLCRILMNLYLSQLELSGEILDLGSGGISASYNRFLRFKKPYTITRTDFYQKGKNVVKVDLEKPFQLGKRRFDFIMCFNVLEHIYNYKNLVKEAHKVLRKDGSFIGMTPFSVGFHPDPNDYFRYTHQAIETIFSQENYRCQKMVYLGFGPFSAALEYWAEVFPRFLRPWLFYSHILVDLVLTRFSPYFRLKHPLGYLYVFKRSEKKRRDYG